MIFDRVGYANFNVTMKIGNKDMLVATIKPPLIGWDVIFIRIYFPFHECSEIKLNTKNMFEDDILEIAKQIIMKKLYKIQNDVFLEMQSVNFKNEKSTVHKHRIEDSFVPTKVYLLR